MKIIEYLVKFFIVIVDDKYMTPQVCPPFDEKLKQFCQSIRHYKCSVPPIEGPWMVNKNRPS
jgi:hypothetical protein